jgi:hypothetical protein
MEEYFRGDSKLLCIDRWWAKYDKVEWHLTLVEFFQHFSKNI